MRLSVQMRILTISAIKAKRHDKVMRMHPQCAFTDAEAVPFPDNLRLPPFALVPPISKQDSSLIRCLSPTRYRHSQKMKTLTLRAQTRLRFSRTELMRPRARHRWHQRRARQKIRLIMSLKKSHSPRHIRSGGRAWWAGDKFVIWRLHRGHFTTDIQRASNNLDSNSWMFGMLQRRSA